MELRPERGEDVRAISAVIAMAFAAAPHSGGNEAAIVDALREAGALTLSLVAVEEGEAVGHAAFSPVIIVEHSGYWFGLGPVSVRPDRQRRGVGSALVRAGLALLREQGADGCVVLGDPAYYCRFGFVADPQLRYGDIPPGLLQRLSFREVPAVGEVAYHPAFNAVAG